MEWYKACFLALLLVKIAWDRFSIQGISCDMNMTAEIIFNIKFGELLNFVNIFCSVQFILINCTALVVEWSPKSEDWKPEQVKEKKLACNLEPVKTLTRKLGRKTVTKILRVSLISWLKRSNMTNRKLQRITILTVVEIAT